MFHQLFAVTYFPNCFVFIFLLVCRRRTYLFQQYFSVVVHIPSVEINTNLKNNKKGNNYKIFPHILTCYLKHFLLFNVTIFFLSGFNFPQLCVFHILAQLYKADKTISNNTVNKHPLYTQCCCVGLRTVSLLLNETLKSFL